MCIGGQFFTILLGIFTEVRVFCVKILMHAVIRETSCSNEFNSAGLLNLLKEGFCISDSQCLHDSVHVASIHDSSSNTITTVANFLVSNDSVVGQSYISLCY